MFDRKRKHPFAPAPGKPVEPESGAVTGAYSDEELTNTPVLDFLALNMEKIGKILGRNADYVARELSLGRSGSIAAELIYFNNLVDMELIEKYLVRPLALDVYSAGLESGGEIVASLRTGRLLTAGKLKTVKNYRDLLAGILRGECALLIDGLDEAYLVNTLGFEHRDIEQPEVEPVVRGPREAFVEVLGVNIALIRRRIHSPNLVFEQLELGTVSDTAVCLVYIRGICSDALADEVRARLLKIRIDGILESSYIEELIQDNPHSVFPQIRSTERPDSVAASLLEGRVAVLVDNTPIALVMPGEFFSLMQSSEDYYDRYWFSSLIRLLRYFAFTLALLLPSLYISIVNFHQEMVPSSLMASIIAARSSVPFPAFLEALAMEITFELLREAGVRLPKPVGQAVSIVGALVIGQAAVQASIVSPLMVIVVALTGISSFCIPQYGMALPVRVLRFALMVLAAMLGMIGVMIGVLFLMLHLFSLESFGRPYMAPLAPFRAGEWKDTVLRASWKTLQRRHNGRGGRA